MDWKQLFDMQRELDQYIARNHQLEDVNVFEERFLALLVELGELANETRCFKFWSKKPSSEPSVILEEYVDNIHFLLSIGIHHGYEFAHIEMFSRDITLTEQFNHVFTTCIDFYRNQSEEAYLKMFQEYLHVATQLGFSEKDIQQAYNKKNEVNYERQEQGY